MFSALANYLDPSVKGVHLEALGTIQQTKDQLKKLWGLSETAVAAGEQRKDVDEAPDDNDELDPTALLLRARKSSGGTTTWQEESQLEKEIKFYEGKDCPIKLQELPTNGNRLSWWKNNEEVLSTLAKAARHVLGVPCSSAKSERVFSTGGQVQVCFIFLFYY